MPPWLKNVPHHKPPLVKPESCYELDASEKDRTVCVLAPGPSFDDFPREKMSLATTIGVNGILEIFEPSYWLFQEGFLAKRYVPFYGRKGCRSNVVTTWERKFICCLMNPPQRLFCYDYRGTSVLRLAEKKPKLKPFWRIDKDSFLPGKATVAANALSLAVLMGARRVVLVGLDLELGTEGRYYAAGVKVNPGPRNRVKALAAGRSWIWFAARAGVWKGPEIVTTSPWLRLRGARRVTVDEAVGMIEAGRSSAA